MDDASVRFGNAAFSIFLHIRSEGTKPSDFPEVSVEAVYGREGI